MELTTVQQRQWLANVAEIRGKRLAGRVAALAFIIDYFADAPSGLLFAVYLDQAMRICDITCLGGGSIDGVQVRIPEVIGQGLSVDAACFILVHNQPRGDPKPSQNGIRVTRRIRQFFKELDMPLLDHFILANGQLDNVADV